MTNATKQAFIAQWSNQSKLMMTTPLNADASKKNGKNGPSSNVPQPRKGIEGIGKASNIIPMNPMMFVHKQQQNLFKTL